MDKKKWRGPHRITRSDGEKLTSSKLSLEHWTKKDALNIYEEVLTRRKRINQVQTQLFWGASMTSLSEWTITSIVEGKWNAEIIFGGIFLQRSGLSTFYIFRPCLLGIPTNNWTTLTLTPPTLKNSWIHIENASNSWCELFGLQRMQTFNSITLTHWYFYTVLFFSWLQSMLNTFSHPKNPVYIHAFLYLHWGRVIFSFVVLIAWGRILESCLSLEIWKITYNLVTIRRKVSRILKSSNDRFIIMIVNQDRKTSGGLGLILGQYGLVISLGILKTSLRVRRHWFQELLQWHNSFVWYSTVIN